MKRFLKAAILLLGLSMSIISCSNNSSNSNENWLDGIWVWSNGDALIISGETIMKSKVNHENGTLPSDYLEQCIDNMFDYELNWLYPAFFSKDAKDNLIIMENVGKELMIWEDGETHGYYADKSGKPTDATIWYCSAIVDMKHKGLYRPIEYYRYFGTTCDDEIIADKKNGQFKKVCELPDDIKQMLTNKEWKNYKKINELPDDIRNLVLYGNTGERVYCCSPKGFEYIYEKPGILVIGKLRNGSEGALVIDNVGKWTKVDASDTTGWVPSKYLQSTPTFDYTEDVAWIEGCWVKDTPHMGEKYLYIFNNGVWGIRGETSGRYEVHDNEIKLIVISLYDDSIFTLNINKEDNNIGGFHPFGHGKYGYMSQEDFYNRGKTLLEEIESVEQSYAKDEDYSWIVGKWLLKTTHGIKSIQFSGAGNKGSCSIIDDIRYEDDYDAKKGYYHVKDSIIHIEFLRETYGISIAIHEGEKLDAGGGNYLTKKTE